jgi:hypothetical protein
LLPLEFGWLLCAVINLLPHQATTNFVVFFFQKSDGRKDAMVSSPIVIALLTVSPTHTPTIAPPWQSG